MEFSKKLVGSTSNTLILTVIGEQERHGYDVVQRVNDLSEGAFQWCEGTVYPALHRLEKEGLIRGKWVTAPSGRRRRVYTLTRQGTLQRDRQQEEWKEFASVVNRVLGACYA